MKTRNRFTALCRLLPALLLCAVLTSCEKHDFIDENVITGNVGPQAYWEVASSTVSAGSEMSFVAQYYSTEAEIDHSEVWYNLQETQDKTVSCPWVTTFTYSISSVVTQEKRISQQIEIYPHSLAVWSDSLHAYTFTGAFPVSGTLSPFSWSKPTTFDSSKMDLYFGEGFMQHFKDSLYTLMDFKDFRNMILGLELMDNFLIYTDSTEDVNAGEGVYTYHFPKDPVTGETPVPDAVKALYDGISFDQLINNTANSCYDVEYKRTYAIEAIMRVYDVNNVYGTTVAKEIDIN